MLKRYVFSAVVAVVGFGALAFAESPFDPDHSKFDDWAPVLVDDDVMPSASEIELTRRWIKSAFGGASFDVSPTPDAPLIVVERQDYSRLRINETCLGEPFSFPTPDGNGKVVYRSGLGTHANSRLRVVCPEPVVAFSAKVGIASSQIAGSARFAVLVDGSVVAESPTEPIRGGDPAFELAATFDAPVQEFTLIVDTTEDGPTCDQANWCEPVVTTASGKRVDLADAAVVSRFTLDPPFSFKYDGVSSRDFLKNWSLTVESPSPLVDVYSWTDPKSSLVVSATVRRFEKFAAADWVLNFTNAGDADSGLIEAVQALDSDFEYGYENAPLAVRTLKGDSCDAESWKPISYLLKPGDSKTLAPVGGRPSNGAFPFWNLTSREYSEDEPCEGLFVALGWSGQWNATFKNANESRSRVTISAGLEEIATVLKPGETIRSPRALVMPWRGDVLQSHALFRRLLMFEYVPKIDGKPIPMEIVAQCFDRYYRKRPGWERAESQIESARKLQDVGGTAYWFDAAWFPVGFPNGVGNWRSDPNNFPNGVEELGNALKEMGLKFILWFEPERVAAGTDIANEHPEFVFGGSNGGLFKLNDPEARKFLGDLLVKRIQEFGVDVYRNDFNLDPWQYWRDADEKNRVGMTQIRYVEGHYELWNRIRASKPGLWIDDCASGGRRIDLETISISVPLWRSDTCCWPGHPEWDQAQTLGLARFLPLFSCVSWDPSPYTFRSAANPGAIMQYNFLEPDYDRDAAVASVREAKAYQKFWYGDFYPLSPAGSGKTNDVAWQLHRPDLDAGLVYFFRQPNSPYPQFEAKLRQIDPDSQYRVVVKANSYDGDAPVVLSGKELQERRLESAQRGSAIVIEYQRIR